MILMADTFDREKHLENKPVVANKRKINIDYNAHSHDFFEIELVLRGSANMVLNGNTHLLKTGDIYFLTPEDIHSVSSINGLELYNIMFTEECLPKDLSLEQLFKSSAFVVSLNIDAFNKMQRICELMCLEQGSTKIYNLQYMQGLLKCMFILLMRNFTDTHSPQNTDMQGVCLYIRRCFKENLTLADVAKYAHLSPTYFCELFRKNVGVGFNDYVNTIRANYAARLIKTTSESITEICYKSGFQSFSTFFRKFKSIYGVSPSEFKRASDN